MERNRISHQELDGISPPDHRSTPKGLAAFVGIVVHGWSPKMIRMLPNVLNYAISGPWGGLCQFGRVSKNPHPSV